MRVLILTRPDEDFIPFELGLLRAGAVPVLVDPGRALAEFAQCVREASVTALAAPAGLHALSLAFPSVFGGVRRRIVTAGRFPGGHSSARCPAN
jgi:acyl-CoA synthetase (AMP-forming)/AMP-acid ligase II